MTGGGRKRSGALVALLAAVAVLAACSGGGSGSGSEGGGAATTAPASSAGPTTTAATASTTAGEGDRPTRGVALSPRSYEEDDFLAFLERAPEAGGLLAHYADWGELGDEDSALSVTVELARQRGMEPVVAVSPYDASQRRLFRPLDAETTARYVEDAAAFAGRHRPPFFGIGVEINLLADSSPADFDRFVELFGEAAAAVHEASPDTRVFVVFQLEWMQGLRGGLFGGTDDPSKAQWDLLDRFPAADLVAFTTYPGLVHRTPADLPDGYYAEIREHTDVPVGFTEVGWAAEPPAEGWPGSEDDQAAFVERFLDLTAGLEPQLAIWTFLYPQPAAEAPFATMSLLRDDGTPRPAWEAWARGAG